ncbi:glycosyltransferase [Ruixingdingia sedimenti]|uniref:Glycosyltransferase n=1 Tax=Ruixingdingia sedimenti TaxID=3073604 RepID=A0ABU1F8U2_9RHOB|nr:glycosyltransferase [Xinfangfangia sp. LG-4]MDR5652862.1 glycosyltransferase [Xinfangfangia sp. LG-4]
MRIAYLVNTYPRPSHTFIRREIRALERRGIAVHRFAMRSDRAALVDPADVAEDARTEHVLKAGAPVLAAAGLRALATARGWRALRLAVGCGRRGGGVLRHLVYLAEAAQVARRCRDLGVAHLHAHFGTNSATVAMLAHELGGPRFSFTVHGPEEFDAPAALSLRQKMARAAFTVAISSFGRSQLMRWARAADWPRIHTVHCGIEPALFAPAPLPEGPARVVAIGRFSEQKGQLLLVRALALAVARAPGLHLVLVGDGELRGAMEAAVAQAGIGAHVTLTGWLDEAGVRAELAAAQALVLPSFAEGLPMVVMEAMAAARPVVATWIAGVPELVVPGGTGWLVPAGDAGALADALVALAGTPVDRLRAMGEAGRARVLARHDIDAEAGRLAALFAAETA